jgi:hypothetical protein
MTLKLTKLGGLNTKFLSAVPPQLNDPSLQLKGTVVILPDQSVSRAFAYVYPGKALVVNAPDLGNYIIADYLEDPKLMIAKGFDWAGYDHSCSSSLAASLKANASWTFPIAQVATALQADLSGKSTYRLALISGTMYSPLWTMYTSNQDQKTYAQMLIWDWYLRHPNATTDNIPRYLLTQFNGVSVYKIMTSSFSKDGKVDASASASLPPINLSGSLQAAYNTLSQTTVESFGLVIRKTGDAEVVKFEPLPSISTISSQLSTSAQARLDSNTTDLRLRPSTSHTQVITGIPASICTGRWRAEKIDAQLGGKLSVGSRTPIDLKDDKSLPACRISIQYDLDPAAPVAEPPKGINLEYNLVTEILDGNTVKATAKIRAGTVSLSSSGLPAIQSSTSMGVPVVNKTEQANITFYTFQWPVVFSVTEDTNTPEKIASVRPIGSGDLKLTCGSRTILPLSASLSYTNSSLGVSVIHAANSSLESLEKDALEPCLLTGRVTFVLNSGAFVQRDLPDSTVFYYREAKPIPKPTPSPSPAPSPGAAGF